MIRILFFLLVVSAPAAASDFSLTLSSPFQSGVEKNGVKTVTPLLIMPCKGSTRPQHPQEGDAYLIVKNITSHSITISMRNDVPVTLTFVTPCGEDIGNKWRPLAYIVHATLPKNPGYMQFVYTLRPQESRIYTLNLFQIESLVDKPLDWISVYSTDKVKIACTFHYDDDNEKAPHEVRTGWIPVTVHEPEADHDEKVPQGTSIEAVPYPIRAIRPTSSFIARKTDRLTPASAIAAARPR
jgi:hypothetical protein